MLVQLKTNLVENNRLFSRSVAIKVLFSVPSFWNFQAPFLYNVVGKKYTNNFNLIIYLYCIIIYTVRSQKNGAVSNVNKKFISYPLRAQRALSAASTV
jgi:hypothetical protein